MLPSAYAIKISGSASTGCQRSATTRSRRDQKNTSAATNAENATTADFSVSCSSSSPVAPAAGATNMIHARIALSTSALRERPRHLDVRDAGFVELLAAHA